MMMFFRTKGDDPVEENTAANSDRVNPITIIHDIHEAFPPDRRPKSPPPHLDTEKTPYNTYISSPEYGSDAMDLSPINEGDASSWRSQQAAGHPGHPFVARSGTGPPVTRGSEYEPPMPGTLHIEERRASCSSDSAESKSIDLCHLYYTEDTRGSSPWNADSPPPPSHVSPDFPKHPYESRFYEDISIQDESSPTRTHRETHRRDVFQSVDLSAVLPVGVQPQSQTAGPRRSAPSWVWVIGSAAVSLCLTALLACLGATLFNGLAAEHLPVRQAVAVAAVTAFIALIVGGCFFTLAVISRQAKRRNASSAHRTMNLVPEMDSGKEGTRLQDDLVAQVVCAVFAIVALTALPLGMAVSGRPSGFGPKEGILVNGVAIGILCMACMPPGLLFVICIRRKKDAD